MTTPVKDENEELLAFEVQNDIMVISFQPIRRPAIGDPTFLPKGFVHKCDQASDRSKRWGLVFGNSTPRKESGASKSILKHNHSSVVTENARGSAHECWERFGPVMVGRQAQQEAADIEGRQLSSSPPGWRSAFRMFHRLSRTEHSRDLSGGALDRSSGRFFASTRCSLWATPNRGAHFCPHRTPR